MLHVVRRNVSVHVVHRHQWNALGERDGLCRSHADQQRPHQTRAVGDTNQIHFIHGDFRLLKGLLNNTVNVLQMPA